MKITNKEQAVEFVQKLIEQIPNFPINVSLRVELEEQEFLDFIPQSITSLYSEKKNQKLKEFIINTALGVSIHVLKKEVK